MPSHEKKILKYFLRQLSTPVLLPNDGQDITERTKELMQLISNIEETMRSGIDISHQQEKFFIIQCQNKIAELWCAYFNMENRFAAPIINDTDIKTCNADTNIIKRAAKKIWDAYTNQQEKHPIVILIELQVHIQSLENRVHQVISALLEFRAFAIINAPMNSNTLTLHNQRVNDHNNSQPHATLFNNPTITPSLNQPSVSGVQSCTCI